MKRVNLKSNKDGDLKSSSSQDESAKHSLPLSDNNNHDQQQQQQHRPIKFFHYVFVLIKYLQMMLTLLLFLYGAFGVFGFGLFVYVSKNVNLFVREIGMLASYLAHMSAACVGLMAAIKLNQHLSLAYSIITSGQFVLLKLVNIQIYTQEVTSITSKMFLLAWLFYILLNHQVRIDTSKKAMIKKVENLAQEKGDKVKKTK